jgi:uncharacterized protein HemX
MERKNETNNRHQSAPNAIKRKPRKRSFKKLGIVVVSVFIVAGLGFVGGMQYQKTQDDNESKDKVSSEHQQTQRLHAGQVTAVDTSSVTIKDNQGKTSKFFVTEDTKLRNRTVDITVADIKVGETITVYVDPVKTEVAVVIFVKPAATPVNNAPAAPSPSAESN